MSFANPRREVNTLIPKHLDRLTSRTYARERFKEVGDCLPDLQVGVERYVASSIVDEAGGEGAAILTPSYLVEDPAPQPGLEDMQFGLAHCSFRDGDILPRNSRLTC